MSASSKEIKKCEIAIYTIEITSNEWHYKIGDVFEFVLIAKSYKSLENIFSREFQGGHMPSYKIVSIKYIKHDPKNVFFSSFIQDSVIKDLSY